jgi:mRNA interferase HigB
MRIIAKSTLRQFWESGHPGARPALEDWYHVASLSTWTNPNAVKDTYGNASIIANDRVVFNIAGNKYRLVAALDYRRGLVFVKFVGTHRQYDQINAATVTLKDQP